MKTTRLLLVLLSFLMCVQFTAMAGALGYNNHRIAISADGNNQPDLDYTGTYNTADPDDWGATPMTLGILAKARLQDKLVHFSYNNFMPSPPHTTETNYMKRNAEDGADRFQFNKAVFFDVGTHKAEAIASLRDELMKSTSADPLYFLHMGPSEFFYQAVKAAVDSGAIEALSHVYVISHSGYNDTHLRRPTEHTMPQCIELSGNRINYKKIADQNTCDIGYKGLCSNTNAYPWRNFKSHRDPNVQWLYERMQDHKHGKYDVSDAGLAYYLLKNSETASPSALDNFFDYGILLPGDELLESIDITESEVTILPKRRVQLEHTTVPAEPWDDIMTWKTSDASVANVSPTGMVIGIGPGTATITVTGGLGNKKDVITVNVSNCDVCQDTCELIEKDGLLVFEAERFNLKGSWKVVEGDNYASGGKYITYYGANSYNNANTANEISYTFKITNPGTYTVKWFMRQPDEAEGDKSNDVWIYIDGDYGYGGTEKLTDYQKFVGRSKTVFAMNGGLDMHDSSPQLTANFPAAGEYTLKISARSEHIQIDKFVFYKGSVSNPVMQASNVAETTTCMDNTGESVEASLSATEVSDIKVYPNPASDNLNVESAFDGSLDIVSMEGRVLKSVELFAGKTTIQLGALCLGNYIARISTKEGVVNQMISIGR